jgi:protein phosphatase
MIREENGTAALEVMSRFAVNPKWLVYLPPTMSPSETSQRKGYLEHPDEAFAYFRSQGVPHVVCEEKHMGSRAVVVLCRDQEAARKRFGIEGESGIVVTRTGRQFFNDADLESALLERVRSALTAAAFWDKFNTTWAVVDCELMPWSAKAQELLKSQYAAVGAAANAALPAALDVIQKTAARLNGDESRTLETLLSDFQHRRVSAQKFVAAYRNYCWPVESLDDFKLAPFHLLATEGGVHVGQNHRWHMETLARICTFDPQLLLATPYRLVDVTDPAQVAEASGWWADLTERGGEGMVVKPLDFIAKGKKGLIQPAVKCRGREYLRIIYGPDYTNEQNLARLRNRGLGGKRSLALREFALGIEALERFVRREPLRRVHECVFGVLALESEPVDPRL